MQPKRVQVEVKINLLPCEFTGNRIMINDPRFLLPALAELSILFTLTRIKRYEICGSTDFSSSACMRLTFAALSEMSCRLLNAA